MRAVLCTVIIAAAIVVGGLAAGGAFHHRTPPPCKPFAFSTTACTPVKIGSGP